MYKETKNIVKDGSTKKELPVDLLGNPIIEDVPMYVDYQTGKGLNSHELNVSAKNNYGKETSFSKVPYKSRIPKKNDEEKSL